MNDYLLFALIFVTLLIGLYFGKLISGLKSKNKEAILEEKNNQLSLQVDEFKNHMNSNLENYKTELLDYKNTFRVQTEKLEKEREEIRREKDFLNTELTRRNAEFENLEQRNKEQKAEVEQLQEKFEKEFENLANKILEQKSEKFTLQNKENIQNILNPLQEKILHFEKRIEEGNKESIDRHAMLRQQIIGLKELNEQMSKEATNLTKALKGDTKTQGNWGEMILERVLERSGLQKGSEYSVQQSFTNADGKRVLPDVVINLPGDKKMIVDSKVSLNAYERYSNETDEQDRKQHLKNHLTAIRNRVSELGNKNYHQLYEMESPDFVLLFIPIEAAFAVASNEYPGLYSEAFDKNIIIVTPTTLLAVLKTIDSMWQNEKQKQNAIAIATQAGALYDSFTALTEELTKIGRQLGTVQNSYEGAMKKLTGKGNLLRRVEKLKKLGAKANKQIDPKMLSAIDEEEIEENHEN
ncbi:MULTISPECIES: DNA recombination protein RmuC [Salegentibacter]|jgi:DNA recombination protein RmuC|uniref:DNA recombination protein RmuC n=1 Tax=Salegentibacter agarivorans TaxID=345907 RepID=A0A1I2PKS9_9FLAO|nr:MULTISPECIES: DNA recombination protein RmuC [Salegentibacter]SFG16150.1 DNA recombination protein RmuC [Salegentibacter agarivorans]